MIAEAPSLKVQDPVLTFDRLDEWNRMLRLGDPKVRIAVANDMLVHVGSTAMVRDVQSADSAMKQIVQKFLDNEFYIGAAVFLLGRSYFDERSVLVKEVFESLHTYDRNSIPGGSSLSKTFSVCIWHAMDWLRDPDNTSIKVSALSDTTLRNNIFNNLTHCFQNMVLNYEFIYGNLFIGLNPAQREGCISGITYPQDNQDTGRFRGIKPIPRSGTPHPQFGDRTRVRLILEEASNMPDGVRDGLNSMEASIGDKDTGRVKITAIFNPFNLSHWTAEISAPAAGITSLDIEKDHQWTSKYGWHVTRLDGKRCENVVQRREVIPCMLSYKKFKEFELRGPNSISCCCYGRGFWPIAGSHFLLIPLYMLENRMCEPLFTGQVVNIGTSDTAVIEDSVVLAPARWGTCVGLVWADGRREMFDGANPHPMRKKPKKILWSEPLIEITLARKDTMIVAEAIRNSCRALKIEPQWLALDSTGSGIGIFDWLRNNFGDVLGIQWATKATERPILENSQQKPCDLYDRVNTEMWFATRDWLENDIVFFSPNFVKEPLFSQLTKRRLPTDREKSFRGKLQIEDKAAYKGHEGGVSPDHADSFVMLQQLLRMRAQNLPGMNTTPTAKLRLKVQTVHDRDTLDGRVALPESPEPVRDPTIEEWLQEKTSAY